jgi:hypothetical protein
MIQVDEKEDGGARGGPDSLASMIVDEAIRA